MFNNDIVTNESWFIKNKKIIEIINQSGGEGRFVGGCIRDFLCHRNIYDIDIASDIDSLELINIFKKNGFKTIPTGIKHGTISVIVDNNNIQVTTLRKDIECDGRHAKIDFTQNWNEDALRRDFTFNALYCDIQGKIYDYFDGIQDLQNKIIRFINNPELRIIEDHLRILRAFRFCTYVNGYIENNSLNACIKYKHKLINISGERIKDEMFKLFKNDIKLTTLTNLYKTSILNVFYPFDIDIHHINEHKVHYFKEDVLLRLAFIISISKKDPKEIIHYLSKRWILSNKEKKILFKLSTEELNLKKLNHCIYDEGTDIIIQKIKLLYLRDIISYQEMKQFITYTNNINIPNFPISGIDIKNKGIQNDKDIGIVKKYLISEWHASNYTLSKEELLNKIINFHPPQKPSKNF